MKRRQKIAQKIGLNMIKNMSEITNGKRKISIDKDVDRFKLWVVLNSYDLNSTRALEQDEIENLYKDVGNKFTRKEVEQLYIKLDESKKNFFKTKFDIGGFLLRTTESPVCKDGDECVKKTRRETPQSHGCKPVVRGLPFKII